MKDDILAPDSVGCAMMTSEKKKSDSSDTIADEQRILAYNTTNDEECAELKEPLSLKLRLMALTKQ